MTVAAVYGFPATLDDIEPDRLLAVVPDLEEIEARRVFEKRQSRVGEEDRGRSESEELRAIYTSPWFWQQAAMLPHNTLASMRPSFRRPRDYPDWLLFLVTCTANVSKLQSRNAAVQHLRDRRHWVDFVHDVDRFVPEGWAQLRQLQHDSGKHQRRNRPRVQAKPLKFGELIHLSPLRETAYRRSASLTIAPPAGHHVDYFVASWEGRKRVLGKWEPLTPADDWFGVREDMLEAHPRIGVDQAQTMGLLRPEQPFQYRQPDRAQAVGVDGTVFRIGKYKQVNKLAGIEQHTVGGDEKNKVIGSKFTITSTRISGQALSRVILGFAHTGHAADSKYGSESEAMVDMALQLRDLTKGGMRMMFADSACRGRDAMRMQFGGVTLVNYPHAQSNPNRGDGNRLAEGRVEKSHLRALVTHKDAKGTKCRHGIYAVGGALVERLPDDEGLDTVRALEVTNYEQRWQRDFDAEGGPKVGKRREYLTVKVPCSLVGEFTHRVALFHTDPGSDDADYNWGEVIRVFAPRSEAFRYLYGGRNDTEARHNDIKSRIKYMPASIRGQELRLLGAAIVINAVSWQSHLQAHGRPNVLDDTA